MLLHSVWIKLLQGASSPQSILTTASEWSWLFSIWICIFWTFIPKVYRPTVTHIPFESGCQTPPPRPCASSRWVLLCLSVQLCCHTNLQLMTYLSAALWELFFESSWEIKILISSAGLLCCLQGENIQVGRVLLCKPLTRLWPVPIFHYYTHILQSKGVVIQ